MLNPRIIFRYIQICSGPLPLAIDKRGSPNKHVHTQTPNPQRAHAHILNPSRLSSTASHSRRQLEEITIKACKRSAGVFQLLHIEEDVGETWRDPLKQTLGRHNRHRRTGVESHQDASSLGALALYDLYLWCHWLDCQPMTAPCRPDRCAASLGVAATNS